MIVGFGLLQLRRATCGAAAEKPLLEFLLSFAWLGLRRKSRFRWSRNLFCWFLFLLARRREFESHCAGKCSKSLTCRNGRVAERFKALVLKTSRGHTLVGSNPTPSAIVFGWCRLDQGRYAISSSESRTLAARGGTRTKIDLIRSRSEPRRSAELLRPSLSQSALQLPLRGPMPGRRWSRRHADCDSRQTGTPQNHV